MFSKENIRNTYWFLFCVLSLYCFYNPWNAPGEFPPPSYSFLHLMISPHDIFNDFYQTFWKSNESLDSDYVRVPWQVIIFQFLGNDDIGIWLVIISGVSVFVNALILRQLQSKCSAVIYWPLFAYPMFFAFFRGNYEFLSFSLLLLAMVFLWSETRAESRSFFFFVLSVFIKPTTILFGALYLRPFFLNAKFRRESLLFGVLALFVVIVLSSLSGEGLLTNISDFSLMMDKYKLNYAIGDGGTLFNNSLWGLFKSLIYLNFDDYDQANKLIVGSFDIFQVIFALLVCMSFLLVAFSGFSLRSVIVLTCASILLAPVAADYRLVAFILPLMIILNPEFRPFNLKNNEGSFYLVLMSLIILPKHMVQLVATDHGIVFTSQSLINPILIIFVMGVAVALLLFDLLKLSPR